MWLTGCTADNTHYWDSNYDGLVEHDYGAVAGVCTLHIEDHFAGTDEARGGAYEVWMGGSYDATKATSVPTWITPRYGRHHHNQQYHPSLAR